MSSTIPRAPNPAKVLAALQIAMTTVQSCQGDVELLQLVVQQLAASSGVTLSNQSNFSTGPLTQSQTKGNKRGQRSRRSRSGSRGSSPGPQTNKERNPQESRPQPAQGPPPNVNSNPQNQPPQVQSRQNVSTQPVRPLVDQTGTSKTTWKSRIKSCRQRALEARETLRVRANQRVAAIFCNAWWTLNEQTSRFKETEFWTPNTADPMRDLPSEATINQLAAALDTSLDPVWRKGENHHYILQDQDGQSLRGSEVFNRVFPAQV